MVNEPPGLATNTELCVSEGNLVVFFFSFNHREVDLCC